MNKKNTITEIETKVLAGLARARECTDDPALLKLCDDLQFTFENLASNLIIVSVGLSAMQYRTSEQIVAQLTAYHRAIEYGKARSAMMFMHHGQEC